MRIQFILPYAGKEHFERLVGLVCLTTDDVREDEITIYVTTEDPIGFLERYAEEIGDRTHFVIKVMS